MLQIFTILGARPQFIKAPALHRAFKQFYPFYVDEAFIHTGQHYDEAMSEVFFRELGIPQPLYHLNVGSDSHARQTGKMMMEIEQILIRHEPHLVVVYGDTNSTLAGALAASKLNIPVAHIESGLRSHQFDMPEEVNRVITDRISTLLFAPTEIAMQNLEAEGRKNWVPDGPVSPANPLVKFTGDVMLDNLLYYGEQDLKQASPRISELITEPFIYCTVHRNFNTDDPKKLKSILGALEEIQSVFAINLIFPVHPRTQKNLDTVFSKKKWSNGIYFIPPVSYFESLLLLQSTRLVITDSGGLQKEAFMMKKPAVILREETEWQEIIDQGAAILAGSKKTAIISAAEQFLFGAQKIEFPALYGTGKAGKKIAGEIVRFFNT